MSHAIGPYVPLPPRAGRPAETTWLGRQEAPAQAPAPRLLVKELRQALDRDELFVAYQPMLRSRTQTIDAVEALVRWRHPTDGVMPPARFVGLLEETGMIVDLTRQVVERALCDRERLGQAGHEVAMQVNLSPRVLGDDSFIDWLTRQAAAAPAGALGVEITAGATAADPDAARTRLQTLADAGLGITIDDFGSGPWSLAALAKLPARELKMDRRFVSSLTASPAGPLVARAATDLAHALGMQATAVGVESPAAMELLRMMGCDLMQGFAISPAIEIAELEAFLAAGPDVQAAEQEPMRAAGAGG